MDRALSKLGLASRTQAAELIRAGKVKVNGRVVLRVSHDVIPEKTKIEIENQTQTTNTPRWILFHKPKGTVTTRSDEKNRPTVFSLLADVGQYLIAVGRLDQATSGLLLLTNDTQFSAWVTDPKNAVPRTYLVTVRGEFSDADASRLESGVSDEGESLSAHSILIRKRSRRETHLVIQLIEGKNREIRRMLKQVGHEVTVLKRVSFGGLELGDLPTGKWRDLSVAELNQAFPGAPIKSSSI